MRVLWISVLIRKREILYPLPMYRFTSKIQGKKLTHQIFTAYVSSMDFRSELLLRRADIWTAKANLSHAEGRYYEMRAKKLLDAAVRPPTAPVQILHPKVPPPLPATMKSPPEEIELTIKGAFCPKWTKRLHHYTLATTQKVIGEKHPITQDGAFFVLIGDEIAFLGLIGAHQTHHELQGYPYQHSIHDGLNEKTKFEVFAKHYNLDLETQKKITRPRVGPKLDKQTTSLLEDIAIRIIESGKLLA
jgi:hypothetical protein